MINLFVALSIANATETRELPDSLAHPVHTYLYSWPNSKVGQFQLVANFVSAKLILTEQCQRDQRDQRDQNETDENKSDSVEWAQNRLVPLCVCACFWHF